MEKIYYGEEEGNSAPNLNYKDADKNIFYTSLVPITNRTGILNI